MLYCRSCGKAVDKKDKTCPYCSADLTKPANRSVAGYHSGSNAVLFAVLSISTCFLPGPGIIFGLIGIVCGKREYSKKTVITSIVGLIFSLISLTIWVVVALK